MKEMYIILDGMDGSGKGTQLTLMQEKFGNQAVFTREPGGTPFAEEIRRLVRDNPLAGQSPALNNFLLFWAAREELQHNLIVPTLEAGKHVFSDRGDSSTFAFQVWGEEHWELQDLFWHMREIVFKGRHEPDLYIVFDLPADVARARAVKDASREPNHFDVRDLAYYERVREGFLNLAKRLPVEIIDATGTPDHIHREVMSVLYTMGIEPA